MNKTTDAMIGEIFSKYVESTDCAERHTDKARTEAGAFNEFCERSFPGNVKLQSEVYDKMMSVAVEYEESGFIAGVKWALAMMNGGNKK